MSEFRATKRHEEKIDTDYAEKVKGKSKKAKMRWLVVRMSLR